MKPKRRKIRLDRGDTLGGTVPLLLSDSVIANNSGGRFLRKEKSEARPGRVLFILLFLLGFGMIGAWISLPEVARNIGIPSFQEVIGSTDT